MGHQPLTHFLHGGVEYGEFRRFSRFQGDPTQKWSNMLEFRCNRLIERIALYHIWKNFSGGPSNFGVIHIRTCARVLLRTFGRVHAHLQTRNCLEIYRRFLVLDYRPLKLIYGVWFQGSGWPPIFIEGAWKLDKLRFGAKVARSSELVCRDRVPIVGAYFRGVFLHSPPPLGGAPTRFRSRISVEAVSYTHLTLPTIYSV